MSKIILFLVGLVSLVLIGLSSSAFAYSPLCSKYEGGVCTTGPCANTPGSAICKEDAQQYGSNKNPINNVLQTVSNIMALLTGLVAVGMIIGSGLVMTTSGGNPERVKKARAILQASIIGLIVVALAWSFVTFVVQNLIQ